MQIGVNYCPSLQDHKLRQTYSLESRGLGLLVQNRSHRPFCWVSFKNGMYSTWRQAGARPWGLLTSTATSCQPPAASSWNIFKTKRDMSQRHLIRNIANSYFLSPASTVFMLAKICLFIDLYLEHESLQLCSLEHRKLKWIIIITRTMAIASLHLLFPMHQVLSASHVLCI